MNLYRYVGNNPVNYIDPLGLTQEELDAAFSWVKGHKPDLIIKETYKPKDQKLPSNVVGFVGPLGRVYIDTEKIKKTLGGQDYIVANLAHEIIHSNEGFIKTLFSSNADHDKIRQAGVDIGLQYLEWLKEKDNNQETQCKQKP